MSDPDDKSPPLIYVSDEKDGERIAAALREHGYAVQRVAVGALAVEVERALPALIFCDLDAPECLAEVEALRKVEGAADIDVLFASDSVSEDATGQSSGTLQRPLDVLEVVGRVQALVGTASELDPRIVSTVPPKTRHRSSVGTEDKTGDVNAEPDEAEAEEADGSVDAPGIPPAAAALLDDAAWDLGRGDSSQPPSENGDDEPSHPSLPAPVPLGLGNVEPDASRMLPQSNLSPELESLLARAEQRVGSIAPPERRDSMPASARLSPDEEVEAVLPAEVLAALDEPLDLDADDDDESDVGSGFGTRSGSVAPRTGIGTGAGSGAGSHAGTHAGGTSAGGGAPLSTAFGPKTPTSMAGQTTGGVDPTAPPPRWTSPGTKTGALAAEPVGTHEPAGSPAADANRPPSWPAPPSAMVTSVEGPQSGGSAMPTAELTAPPAIPPVASAPIHPLPTVGPPQPRVFGPTPGIPIISPPSAPPAPAPDRARPGGGLQIPSVLRSGDALTALARAVGARFSGALAFEDQHGIRRVVMRDGDFVTAASGAETETLVAFLKERGSLTQEAVSRIGHRLPPFGRHAGAALIANGHLRQDELWLVLRAHSEWIIGHIVQLPSGGASIEGEVPPRLAAEPAVFGGATGAEVLVEITRRVVSTTQALEQLGGARARLADGPRAGLLSECALSEAEVALINRGKSMPVGDVANGTADAGFAAVLLALVRLGVLEVLSAARPGMADEPAEPDPLDENAVRVRITARRALVDEGDYFALLGLPRGATGYDVRRAYLELRRELEPARVLTTTTADLSDDLSLILEVLDEAYEILRDNVRRERYRRALEATPR